MSNVIFMAVCFAVDFIFSSLFPPDFALQQSVVIPAAAFFAMLALAQKADLLHAVYLAFIVGLFSDFFNMSPSLIETLLAVLAVLLMRMWDRHLSNSLFEQMLLFLSTLFVKEFCLYLFLLMGGVHLSIVSWTLNRAIPTLLGNIVLVLIVLGLYELKKDYDAKEERNKRREESLFWKKFR